MRVLLISHTCQSRREGQPKAAALARIPDLELMLLVPDRWRMYGRWHEAEPALSPSFRYEVARVRMPWVGPAQNYLHHYPSLRRLMLEFRPDVIDLWEEPWSLVSAQATYLRNRCLPQARIVSETEQNIDKRLPPPFERFRRYTLRHAAFLVGRSEEAVGVARSKGYRGPAAAVPNAVDAELFRPLERTACRTKLDLPRDAFVAGYVGRLVPEKGLADLLAAAARVESLHLVLAGGGPDEAALRSQGDARGLGGRLRFLGPRPLDGLPEVMNALDALVLPSRTTARWKEQFGRVLIEAQACGVAVIGSDSGAIPDVVGDAGLVFPEGDVARLAAALVRLRDDGALRRKCQIAGTAQVRDRYTWDRVAHQMHGIYHRVLESHGEPSAANASLQPTAA